MYLNTSYQILKRESSLLLVNIENGDVYEINDVTESILTHCKQANTTEELVSVIFDIYGDTHGDFSQLDLSSFITELISSGIILID